MTTVVSHRPHLIYDLWWQNEYILLLKLLKLNQKCLIIFSEWVSECFFWYQHIWVSSIKNCLTYSRLLKCLSNKLLCSKLDSAYSLLFTRLIYTHNHYYQLLNNTILIWYTNNGMQYNNEILLSHLLFQLYMYNYQKVYTSTWENKYIKSQNMRTYQQW